MSKRDRPNSNEGSALTPLAECAVQRAEASIEELRETGDTTIMGRIHYELAQAARSQDSSLGPAEDNEMSI